MMMVVAAVAGAVGVRAESGDLFIYPSPPDSMQTLQRRCDFIVARFWDRCNFGTAFRHEQQLESAFSDWVGIIPHASADTVHVAVDKLLARFAKKGPETLALAQIAERQLYSDSAVVRSSEVFLPFARAAAAHKKISKTDRAHFAALAQRIESSSVGSVVPAIDIVNADGTRGSFADVKGGSILIFFYDPEKFDCTIARVRLSADQNTRELIERGELTVALVYPGNTADEGWTKTKADAPEQWRAMAMPDAAAYFETGYEPAFYFLNARHKVLAAGLTTDYLLGAFRTANTATKERLKNTEAAQ